MLRYTSVLDPAYSDDLERLVFFNPGQKTMHAAIVESQKKFGSPSVYTEMGGLRIKLEKLDEVQTLYAMDDDRLAGVLIYTRIPPEHLTVIYIAVDYNYSSRGKYAQKMLVMRMFELLRSNARRIRGVKTIRVNYGANQIVDYTV